MRVCFTFKRLPNGRCRPESNGPQKLFRNTSRKHWSGEPFERFHDEDQSPSYTWNFPGCYLLCFLFTGGAHELAGEPSRLQESEAARGSARRRSTFSHDHRRESGAVDVSLGPPSASWTTNRFFYRPR